MMLQTFLYRFTLRGKVSKVLVSRDPRVLYLSTAYLTFVADKIP